MSHEIQFNFKARYYKLGEVNSSTKQIWWVLHGYGQLSQFFIQKFKALTEQGICVIAPEGLSKFYLAGNGGRVGATWMTRENRLVDIKNYIEYLNTILQIENPTNKVPTTLFGFSQGAATTVRWAMDGKVKFDRLILWAGLFPPDMDFEKGAELLKDKKIIEVLGKQDQFITREKVEEMMKLNQQLKINPAIVEFEGKHEIDEGVLGEVAFL
jgi:predicted esterase